MLVGIVERRAMKKLRSEYYIEEDADDDLPFSVRVPDIATQSLVVRAKFASKKEAIIYAELYSNRVGKCLQCKKIFKKLRRDNELCSKACKQKLFRQKKKEGTLTLKCL